MPKFTYPKRESNTTEHQRETSRFQHEDQILRQSAEAIDQDLSSESHPTYLGASHELNPL